MDKKINTIYETSNYDQFKRLIGNRKDDEVRGKALMLSIKTFGQLDPISVNEKMEVIDGQARLYALRQLGLPVKYYIEELDCRAFVERTIGILQLVKEVEHGKI